MKRYILQWPLKIVVLFLFIVVIFILSNYIHFSFPVSLSALLFLTITFILTIVTLLILRKKTESANISALNTEIRILHVVAIPLIAFTVAYLEIMLMGHLFFFSCLLVFTALIMATFGRGKPVVRIMMGVASIGELVIALYGFYMPSFGSDTWRDSAMAQQILLLGDISKLSIVHDAYPMPVLPILYTTLSLMSGINALESSVVMGLIYLIFGGLFFYLVGSLIGRKHGLGYLSSLMFLSSPLTVVFSTAFIPQAYALLLALLVTFITFREDTLRKSVVVFLIIAMVMGHSGIASFYLFILFVLWLLLKLERENKYFSDYHFRILLALYFIIYLLYLLYTSVVYHVVRGTSSILEALRLFLLGVKIESENPPQLAGEYPAGIVIMYYWSLSVSFSLILSLILSKKAPRWNRYFTFVILSVMVIAFIVSQAYPAFDAVRYLGYTSFAMLLPFLPLGWYVIFTKSHKYAIFLVMSVFISFAASVVNTPERPLSALSPQFGVLTFTEQVCLNGIPLVGDGRLAMDFVSGLYTLWHSASAGMQLATPVGMYHRFVVKDYNVTVYRIGAYGVTLRDIYKPGVTAVVVRSRVVESNMFIWYDDADKRVVRELLYHGGVMYVCDGLAVLR
ncbi:hypothetical protein [Pyrobaculum aerophilum]|uniref:Glycosyltransferase RgtA/B/C/D-like domain-containing protein n=1 Tax=Pyrobaculum aerophilum TaxID=13773 RepID=A0A371QV58_9CREN|nr:hypothetical protein [Pyrobaculum aerophilum]RFA93924.1 hypothetical protein CGL51_11755 [Pyrobaculum aerophilum]RFA94895.1 hypothetical protein CGL52_13840 [Pyrobaculum aerophilum]